MNGVRKVIEKFVKEHKEILSRIEKLEKDLSEENIKELIKVLKEEVERHGKEEEEKLEPYENENFDIEALRYAHDQIKYALEELETSPTAENARNAINLLKAHFMEEENIFFPQVMGLEPELGEEGD